MCLQTVCIKYGHHRSSLILCIVHNTQIMCYCLYVECFNHGQFLLFIFLGFNFSNFTPVMIYASQNFALDWLCNRYACLKQYKSEHQYSCLTKILCLIKNLLPFSILQIEKKNFSKIHYICSFQFTCRLEKTKVVKK